MEARSYRGPTKVYSEEFKQEVLRRIESGEFNSIYHAAFSFGLQRTTISRWMKSRGIEKKIKQTKETA